MERTFYSSSIDRAYHYPVVKDTLDTAHSYVASNSYASSLYDRVAALSASILHRLEFLQSRLPLDRVDGYANGALDFVEKKFPQVKLETNELVGKARQPADYAVETAQNYKKGIESRLGSVNESFYHRIAQSQETLHGLQDRLAKTVAKFPHDQASLKKTLSEFSAELDSIVKSVPSLPSQAQATAQPYLEGLGEAAQYVKKEVSRTDVPLSQRAQNILNYSQEKLTPVLDSVKSYAFKGKKEVEEKGEEVKEKTSSE
ncbi:hypothetical protein JCM5353_001671 [Sporobolomyces roseus]